MREPHRAARSARLRRGARGRGRAAGQHHPQDRRHPRGLPRGGRAAAARRPAARGRHPPLRLPRRRVHADLRHQQLEQPLQLQPAHGDLQAHRNHRVPEQLAAVLDGRRPQGHRVHRLPGRGAVPREHGDGRVRAHRVREQPGRVRDDVRHGLLGGGRRGRVALRRLGRRRRRPVAAGHDRRPEQATRSTSGATSDPQITRAELTGTGAGGLFGFWQRVGTSSSAIVQIDKATAKVTNSSTLNGVDQGSTGVVNICT